MALSFAIPPAPATRRLVIKRLLTTARELTISQSVATLGVWLRAAIISILAHLGVPGENNTIRIGDPAFHQNVYINGIPAGGLAAILFDYNTGTIAIGVGGAVPFNQAPLIVGTAISKTNNTTFTLIRTVFTG